MIKTDSSGKPLIHFEEVIIARNTTRGKGIIGSPVRAITQVYSKEGELIAEYDPLQENPEDRFCSLSPLAILEQLERAEKLLNISGFREEASGIADLMDELFRINGLLYFEDYEFSHLSKRIAKPMGVMGTNPVPGGLKTGTEEGSFPGVPVKINGPFISRDEEPVPDDIKQPDPARYINPDVDGNDYF